MVYLMLGRLGHMLEEGHQGQDAPYVGRDVCARAVTCSWPMCVGVRTVLPSCQFLQAVGERSRGHWGQSLKVKFHDSRGVASRGNSLLMPRTEMPIMGREAAGHGNEVLFLQIFPEI